MKNGLNVKYNVPLADRMRPETLDNFVGQENIIGQGKILRQAIEGDNIPSIIFWGPPGCGKTTLARIIARKTKAEFSQISAVTSGVKDIRAIVAEAEKCFNWEYARFFLLMKFIVLIKTNKTHYYHM